SFSWWQSCSHSTGSNVPCSVGNGLASHCYVVSGVSRQPCIVNGRISYCEPSAFLCILDQATVHRSSHHDFGANYVAPSIEYCSLAQRSRAAHAAQQIGYEAPLGSDNSARGQRGYVFTLISVRSPASSR